MDRDVARRIAGAGRSVGLQILHNPVYSGRGMLGEMISAVESDTLGEFIAAVALASAVADQDWQDTSPVVIANAMKEIRQDQLGKSLVFY
jgi:hypothetical protein